MRLTSRQAKFLATKIRQLAPNTLQLFQTRPYGDLRIELTRYDIYLVPESNTEPIKREVNGKYQDLPKAAKRKYLVKSP